MGPVPVCLSFFVAVTATLTVVNNILMTSSCPCFASENPPVDCKKEETMKNALIQKNLTIDM